VTEYKCGEMHMAILPKGPDIKDIIQEVKDHNAQVRINPKLLHPSLGLSE
jgi:hypothetical protein